MKRLVTILFGAILFVGLSFGQSSPMVVYGNVKIATGGIVTSKGPVKVNAAVLTEGSEDEESVTIFQNAKIENEGTLNLPGGITFVSEVSPIGNTTGSDGMLYNKTSTAKADLTGVTPANVKVVKKFKETDDFYLISFPFDVNVSSITGNAHLQLDPTSASASDADFWLQYYDIEGRAANGAVDDSWTWITSNSYVLKAGVGYLIYVSEGTTSGNVELEFPAANTAFVDANGLLPYNAVNTNVIYEYGPNTASNSGWNILGTLQTTSYNLKDNLTLEDDNGDFGFVYLLDGASSATASWVNYAIDVDDLILSPNMAFFVQLSMDNYGDGDQPKLEFNGDGRSFADAAYRSSDFSENNNSFKLSLLGKDDVSFDWLYIRERENASNQYRGGEDGIKFFSSTKVAQFYTVLDDYPMAYNKFRAIPENAEIPVGLKVKETGDYTIRLENLVGFNDVNGIYVVDKDRNIVHNLLESDYTFESNPADTEARLALRLDRAPTGLNSIQSIVNIYVEDNTAYVKNIKVGDEVSIYNVTGQLINRGIATSDEQSYRLSGTGIFIVKVTGSETLISKKVINK
jgi:hypothetical protein